MVMSSGSSTQEWTLGERLGMFRRHAGLSQKELAVRVGVSRSTMVRFENDHGDIPSGVLARIAVALGISADQLLGLIETRVNGIPCAPDNLIFTLVTNPKARTSAPRVPLMVRVDGKG